MNTRHINLRHMELLREVVQAGGVAAAAKKLGLAQPTLSIQLRQLSQALGTVLFEQVGRKIALTPAGREVLGAAQDIDATLLRLQDSLRSQRTLESGELRVAMASTAEYFLPRMLGSFRKAHPGVDARMLVLNREALLQRFAQNIDDFIVMTRPPEDERIVSIELLDNPLVLIAARDHPLANTKITRLAQLQPHEFVEREAGSGTRLITQEYLSSKGVQMKWRIELGSNEAIKQAVAGGLGLAVLSALTLDAQTDADGIRTLNAPGFPIPAKWYALVWRGKRLSPSAVAFIEHLRQSGPGLMKKLNTRLERLARQPIGPEH
jgi:LysR family transcriptional regulator, low CO2-responsive transcriptional regulator